MKPVRAWRLLAAQELAAIQCALVPPVQAWQQHCLPKAPALQLHVQAADCVTAMDCRISVLDKNRQVCAQLDCAPSVLHWLQDEAGLGKPDSGGQSPLVRGACLHLLRDLLARLAGLPAGSTGREDLFSMRHESLAPARGWGAVRLSLQAEREAPLAMQLILTHSLIARCCQPLPAKRGGLNSRQGLADHLRLRYRLLAGSLELPLSALGQLEPGDVLRLDTRVQQGLQLVGAQGQHLCRADLGLHAGQATLQICGD